MRWLTISRFSILRTPEAHNEPVKDYAPGSSERAQLQARLRSMQEERIDIPMVIAGQEVTSGDIYEAVMPHDTKHVLGDVHQSGVEHFEQAVAAAGEAHRSWAAL
ncbi:MAG: 1-pyrroline-5-carboxylate dehydrogenase, partial [Actinomycetota bacterium]|nr:1-pyrroline-5-carboxylate dehydrogenase [Actinomycetota bacterium]